MLKKLPIFKCTYNVFYNLAQKLIFRFSELELHYYVQPTLIMKNIGIKVLDQMGYFKILALFFEV